MDSKSMNGDYINGHDKIVSHLEFIDEKISNLQNKISESTNFSEDKHDVNSMKEGNRLYSGMNNIMNTYTNAQEVLMSKLNKEAEFIRYVGKKYYELDQELEREAEKL